MFEVEQWREVAFPLLLLLQPDRRQNFYMKLFNRFFRCLFSLNSDHGVCGESTNIGVTRTGLSHPTDFVLGSDLMQRSPGVPPLNGNCSAYLNCTEMEPKFQGRKSSFIQYPSPGLHHPKRARNQLVP